MRIVSTGKISTVFFRHGFLSMVDFFRQIWDCFGSKNFNWIFSTQFLVKGWLFSTKLELFWLKKFRLNFFDTVSCQWLTKTNPAQTLKFPELFSIEDQRNSVNAWTQNFWERKGRMERAKLISEKGSGEGGGSFPRPFSLPILSKSLFCCQLVNIFYSGRLQTIIFMTNFILLQNWCHNGSH